MYIYMCTLTFADLWKQIHSSKCSTTLGVAQWQNTCIICRSPGFYFSLSKKLKRWYILTLILTPQLNSNLIYSMKKAVRILVCEDFSLFTQPSKFSRALILNIASYDQSNHAKRSIRWMEKNKNYFQLVKQKPKVKS